MHPKSDHGPCSRGISKADVILEEVVRTSVWVLISGRNHSPLNPLDGRLRLSSCDCMQFSDQFAGAGAEAR